MYRFDFGARVDQGRVRETNQDLARIDPDLGLVLVADGMGGHELGEVASRVAAEALLASFDRAGGVAATPEQTEDRLVRGFHEANTFVRLQPGSGQGERMGTTLVAVAFGQGFAVVANVGDSRCYLVRPTRMECLTRDHSLVAEIRRHGRAATQASLDSHQNLLTRCIGGEDEVTVDTEVVRCDLGDVFVLCSDGLWGGVSDRALERVIRTATDAEDACEKLIGAAWQAGGLDNIAVAVVRLVPFNVRAEKPQIKAIQDSVPPGP
jgi:protein phosphatase